MSSVAHPSRKPVEDDKNGSVTVMGCGMGVGWPGV